MYISLYVLCIVLGVFLVCIASVVFLWRKNQALTRLASARRSDLDRTSKILIEKNLELVDQTLLQQKMLESKDDFISIVSHQLRTPITEIKWNVDTILKNPNWKLEVDQRKSLEILYSSVLHMIQLINNIVHLVSVEQGSKHLATVPYDPDPVIEHALQQAAKGFTVKRISFSFTSTVTCLIASIDPDSLTMLVSNLIENAFHYTAEGGTIMVKTIQTNHNELTIVVKDNGMGMSLQQQETVFQKFRRGTNAIAVNARGSGLGLYIVKKITQQQHGTILFESIEGVGTTFTLTLPLAD